MNRQPAAPQQSTPHVCGVAVDHVVVAATTLEDGVRWCAATLGVDPGPGGAHPLMGTYNRLLPVAGPGFARTYLEIIAIDPSAVPVGRAPGARRWFDLDDAALRSSLAQDGPRLIHFVASVPDIAAAHDALAQRGIDRGEILAASRATAAGLLRWQITVRADGRRLFGGALPTLIEWGAAHPFDAMPAATHAAAVTLRAVSVTHPDAPALAEAFGAIGLGGVDCAAGPAGIAAVFDTPRGSVTLASGGV